MKFITVKKREVHGIRRDSILWEVMSNYHKASEADGCTPQGQPRLSLQRQDASGT